MIRYKDHIFEQYSICPATGMIFDANTGVVQKTYLNTGRPWFKKMPVHCIMAHTFYGYKPGYDVHHLDENKQNNALSNLVYLTRAEHNSLHHKGKSYLKGKHHSEETKAKISAANKGKQLLEETKEKMSSAHKGKYHSVEIKGKISATLKGRHWWHLPTGETAYSKESPGKGWLLGRK